MIQDIQPQMLSNTYRPGEPKDTDYLVAFRENCIFMKDGPQTGFLTCAELAAWCLERHKKLPRSVYLFSIGDENYFLTEISDTFAGEKEREGYTYIRMFGTRGKKPKKNVFAAATAWHLFTWYRDNRFCGRCGAKLSHSSTQRMLVCRECKNMVFPKIAPAVIVGVTDGSRILMTKYAGREYKKYALVAGFTEIGETAEETVRREVMEETGLSVENIRYYKSQPWGFDQNLLLGYFCDLKKGDQKIHMDEEELAEAEWVDYREIPDDNEELSLTREMMISFREEQRKLCLSGTEKYVDI